MDKFAQIAANGIGGREELLCEPQPMEFEKIVSELTEKSEPLPVKKKIDSRDELYDELDRIKKEYEPYLKELAPEMEAYRESIKLENFNLDGKQIKIPNYGAPVGKHKQVYTTEFELNITAEKAAYVCFEGADYYAVVYVNGVCVGTHEGFFSPFEFEITDAVKNGRNTLQVDLYNDYIYMGNSADGSRTFEGDKLYAATGPGWDDPEIGWHHCPPGMGLYNDVRIEVRNRLNITDLYIRPLDGAAEIQVEIENADYTEKCVEIDISLYGQNFRETVLKNYRYVPETIKTVGRGDSLTEASLKDEMGKGMPMPLKHGKNIFKIPVEIKNPKIWEPDKPYLYQAQVKVLHNNKTEDAAKQQFGMRSFEQDTEHNPKGMFRLNGRKIRLRGANTMGFEQQDVMRGDTEQLIDDILLAKLCNMNFLRLTQRPIQDKVYEYCDKLGLMTQTDLPLFGCMRRTKICEGVRQAEEMERMVRTHPCNIIISYINEPFPNANNEPHRHLNREELESFFAMCDTAVKIQNPDRVIKHIDGDYDPPTEGMPDNHCYPMWYNGHGIDIGRLHKGYWLSVKPNWYYGCGEYGAEGLDFAEVMQNNYPSEWLKAPFDPINIVNAQTGSFYYFFYDRGESMEDWIEKSQKHQAFATTVMTEAFRRNDNMVSNAIHLFIDAWPSGWMKTIMDCKRNPKPAYFAYRNALEPIHLSLRTDRNTYFEGDRISIECYLCNDTNTQEEYTVRYEMNGKACECYTFSRDCGVNYVSNAEITAGKVSGREKSTIRAILTDKNGAVVTYSELQIEVFEAVEDIKTTENELILNLQPGEYEIAGEKVVVKPCGMLPVHFVSAKTGHRAVEEFERQDFSYWYNKKEDMITPILSNTFEASGFTPILTSGNMDEDGKWHTVMACGEKEYNGKRYIICNVDLRCENPVAQRLLNNLKNR